MLGYLQGHSCADITFAVSQVSRYTFCPKRSHELALEHIGRYLIGALKKALSSNQIEKPTNSKVTSMLIQPLLVAWAWSKEQTLTLLNLALASLLKLWAVP